MEIKFHFRKRSGGDRVKGRQNFSIIMSSIHFFVECRNAVNSLESGNGNNQMQHNVKENADARGRMGPGTKY